MMIRPLTKSLKSPVCALCSHPLHQARRPLSLAALARPTTTNTTPPPNLRLAAFKRNLQVQAQPPAIDAKDLDPEFDDDEPDPTLAQSVIHLTDQAINQITRAQDKAKNDNLALRVSVESGGCHGYQYKMEVTADRQSDDYLFHPPNFKARVLIDSSSLALLSGSTIDYATELIGSSFRITDNPHANDKGGCGCGVSWELKE
ncbi:hypothetical protein T439DRAFT_326277 [Meredithblackwellia eburnea MCA 4105]